MRHASTRSHRQGVLRLVRGSLEEPLANLQLIVRAADIAGSAARGCSRSRYTADSGRCCQSAPRHFFSPWRAGCETRPNTRCHRPPLVLTETTLISDMLPLKCLLHVTRPKAIFGGHRFEKECVAWRSGYVSERRSPERQPECQTPAVLKRRPRYTDGVTKARRD